MFSSLLPHVALRTSARAFTPTARISAIATLARPAPTWSRSFITTAPTSFARPAKVTDASETSEGKTTKRKPAAKKTATKKAAKEATEEAAPKKPRKAKEPSKEQTLRATYLQNKPPKRPTSVWSVFLSEHIQGRQGRDIGDSVKQASAAYKALSVSEKQHYEREAEKINEARREAWENYNKSLDPAALRAVNLYLKGGKVRKQKIATPSRLVKHSGHNLFFKEQYPKVETTSDMTQLEIGKYKLLEINARWKALSDAEKQVYKDRAAESNAEKGL